MHQAVGDIFLPFFSDILWVPSGQAFWAGEQLSAAGRSSSAHLKILPGHLSKKNVEK